MYGIYISTQNGYVSMLRIPHTGSGNNSGDSSMECDSTSPSRTGRSHSLGSNINVKNSFRNLLRTIKPDDCRQTKDHPILVHRSGATETALQKMRRDLQSVLKFQGSDRPKSLSPSYMDQNKPIFAQDELLDVFKSSVLSMIKKNKHQNSFFTGDNGIELQTPTCAEISHSCNLCVRCKDGTATPSPLLFGEKNGSDDITHENSDGLLREGIGSLWQRGIGELGDQKGLIAELDPKDIKAIMTRIAYDIVNIPRKHRGAVDRLERDLFKYNNSNGSVRRKIQKIQKITRSMEDKILLVSTLETSLQLTRCELENIFLLKADLVKQVMEDEVSIHEYMRTHERRHSSFEIDEQEVENETGDGVETVQVIQTMMQNLM